MAAAAASASPTPRSAAAAADTSDVVVEPLPLVRSVAILSRHKHQVFLKSYVEARHAAHELAAFVALDGVDTHVGNLSATAGGAAESRPPYLGLLQAMDDEKTFGWVTSTGVKLLLTVHDRPVREAAIKDLLHVLHVLYSEAICNPFADVDRPSTQLGARFEARVDAVVAQAAPMLPFTSG